MANEMSELAILAASVFPKEELINMLKEAIEKYQEDPTEENEVKVEYTAILYLTKRSIGYEPKGVVGVREELAKIEQGRKLVEQVSKTGQS